MGEALFQEGMVDNEKWDHFKYQFCYVENNGIHDDDVYDWCLDNLRSTLGWIICYDGVVIFEEEDAMAFKLRWM